MPNIETGIIPNIHHCLAPEDVKENGQLLGLLDEKETQAAIKALETEPFVPLEFKNPEREVIKIGENGYVIYKKKPAGQGTTGDVYIAQLINLLTSKNNINTNNLEIDKGEQKDDKAPMFAVKVIRKYISSASLGERTECDQKAVTARENRWSKETRLLKKMNLSVSSSVSANSYQIVMPLAPGNNLSTFWGYEKIRPMISTLGILQIIANCAKAISQLHKNGIIHRDIQYNNLMIDLVTKLVSVVDLGLAIETPDGEPLQNVGTVTDSEKIGSQIYNMPEFRAQKSEPYSYSEKTEVFALGVTLTSLFLSIKNPDIQSKLKALLKSMLGIPSAFRPSLEKIQKILQEIIEQDLLILHKINNIALLDIDEYTQSDLAGKEQLIEALRQCDHVLFFANNRQKFNQLSLIKLRIELEGRGVSVGNKIFYGSDSNRQAVPIQDIMIQIPRKILKSEPDSINHYFFVTRKNIPVSEKYLRRYPFSQKVVSLLASPGKKPVDYQRIIKNHLKETLVDIKHVDMVIESLEVELKRLENKYTEENALVKGRITRINALIHCLNSHPKKNTTLTYVQLYSQLNELRQSMFVTGWFSYVFRIPSTGARKITATSVKISNIVDSAAEVEAITRFGNNCR